MFDSSLLTSRLTTLPHLPDIRILAVIIPLYFQAWLLVVPQNVKTRSLRLAIVPFGLYLSGNFARYDFQPQEGFRV